MKFPRWWFTALAAATFVTHVLAWQAPEYDDDWRHRAAMDRVVRGEQTLSEFLCARHNEHVLPLWKAWCYATYRTWDRNPLPRHVAISAAHLIGAIALVIALRPLIGPNRALTAGFIWAGGALGNFDAPHVWIGSSHATFGVAAWLVASAIATGYSSRWWPLAAIALCAAWTASLAFMLPLLLLTPALFFQVVFIEFPKLQNAALHKACFLCAILLPAGAGVVAQVVVPIDETDRRQPGPRSLVVAAEGTGLLFAASLGNLTFPPSAVGPTNQDHLWHSAIAAPIAVAIGLLALIGIGLIELLRRGLAKPGGRRMALAWACMAALPWTFLACYHCSDEPPMQLASRGRYRVPPTLFWAVAVGTLPITLPHRTAIPIAIAFLGFQAACNSAAAAQLNAMHRANYPTAVQVYGFKD